MYRSSCKKLIFSLCRLQILESVIKHRWGAIDDTQRAGIRNFVSNLIIKLSSDEQLFRQERVYLNKLNIALVQVSISRKLQVSILQGLACTREDALPRLASSCTVDLRGVLTSQAQMTACMAVGCRWDSVVPQALP